MTLFNKYNLPTPRYTSYPTLPYWNSPPSHDSWWNSLRAQLDKNTLNNSAASLYVHIPFCCKLCSFCACNKKITRNYEVVKPYTIALLQELQLYLSNLDVQHITANQIYLGGGTPTFYPPQELYSLLSSMFKYINFTPDAELAIEVDPRVTKVEHLKLLSQLGFNRISLGVQDFDLDVQKIINRVQSLNQVKFITDLARKYGFDSINYDLIYGLPRQSVASIQHTIKQVIKLKPDRIAFYAYAHVPWVQASHRLFNDNDIPVGFEKVALYLAGRELLLEAGYKEIGMDHFSHTHDKLWLALEKQQLQRNFMGYTTDASVPLIAFGASGISDSWDMFRQNNKDISVYQDCLAKGKLPTIKGHILTLEDTILRKQILNLMTEFNTTWDPSAGNLTDFWQCLPVRLREPCADNLIKLTSTKCVINPQGRPFVRNICTAFDARMVAAQAVSQANKFSNSF